jgi:DNA recombination protein RmuC
VDPLAIILADAAMLGGIAVGWFFGSRPVADWKARHGERDAEAREHEAQFKQAVTEQR